MNNKKETDWLEGEELVWQQLLDAVPDSVCRNAKADYNKASGSYILPVFNMEITVSPGDRSFQGHSDTAELLLNSFSQYSRLAILCYLSGAQDVPLADNLINPRQLSGGDMFVRGSHMLPLDSIAEKYSQNSESFITNGMNLGGERLDYGDFSFRLLPFPRVPVVLIVWKADDEFPARAELLFDASCTQHLSTDILWATAMMIIMMMLHLQ